jgi:vancomycin permeability regulator SanA
MVKKIFNMLIRILFWTLLSLILLVVAARVMTALYAKNKMFSVESVSASRVAVVFGAGLQYDGSPSPILRDRVETAANLYKAGKVEKILMSGDNRFVDYNEPGAMRVTQSLWCARRRYRA